MKQSLRTLIAIVALVVLALVINLSGGRAAARPIHGDETAADSAAQPQSAPPAAGYRPSITLENFRPGGMADFLTAPDDGFPLDIALNYVYASRQALGLTEADLAEMTATDYFSQASNMTQVELQQQLHGIDVHNGSILVNINRDGRILNLHSLFVPDLVNQVNTTKPTIPPAEAVSRAAAFLDLDLRQELVVQENLAGPSQAVLFNGAGISRENIPARLVLQPLNTGQVRLAWEMEIHELHTPDWWSIRIDAVNGGELDRFNFTIHEDFLAQARLARGDASPAGAAGPLGVTPEDPLLANTYNVYAWPVESPNFASPAPPADARTLEANPAGDASPNGSPFGWHATGTSSWTWTQGNNVNAQKSGTHSNCGAGLDCDHVLDLTMQPTSGSNVDVAIDNLFYWNNIIHDVWYNYGFDEPSRNFQEDNNGMGGSGSDSVTANAQAPGNCNANFGTPSDGSNPTMNMFTCNNVTPSRDGDLDNGVIIHEYTHGISNRLTGGASVNCLNNQEQMGEGWSDWYALVMTMETGDSGTDSRPMGTWLLGEGPTGPGIRQYPYSTDMGVNPHTYGDVGGVAVPHGVGSIWTAMLWEVNWALIANGTQSGLDPDIYNGTGGNNLAMQLVTDGMKLQPCSPGFVDGRDAILLADLNNNGGANQCLIWEAFAKRGLGFSASQGSSNSTGDGTEAFDVPASCDFLNPTPSSLDVCVGSDAIFPIDVNPGFTSPPVTMSASGHPAGSTAAFTPNPVNGPLPNSTSLTISGIGAAAVGGHTVVVTGTDGLNTSSDNLTLNVFPSALSAPALSTPADGAVDVSVYPTLTWAAVSGAADYEIEIATSPVVTGSIVVSDTVVGASYTPVASLGSSTVYYWRVRAGNLCTDGGWSPIFAFRTSAVACTVYPSTDVPLSIPPSGTSGTTTSIVNVPDSGTIIDVNVLNLVGTHTYMGDLDFYLDSPSATQVQLREQACGTDEDFNINYDDAAASSTPPCPPTDGLTYQPFGNLSDFNGETNTGTWTLTIEDRFLGDSGQLDSWSLEICTGGASVSADYSDLASSYGVAWHEGAGAYRLGTNWTADTGFGQGGDDADDDGVVRAGGSWLSGNTVNLQVTTNNAGYLAGWFDWDGDGSFAASEKAVGQSVIAGVQNVSLTVGPFDPAATPALSARFRFYDVEPTFDSPLSTESPTGGTSAGEVEDYIWTFSPTAIDLRVLRLSGASSPLWLLGLLALFLAALTFGLLRWRSPRRLPGRDWG